MTSILASAHAEMARNDAMARLRAELDGCQYGREITAEQEAFAKANDLVVVFGYSDDGVQLRGAISDDLFACDGTTLRITPLGLLPDWETFIGTGASEAECQQYFANKAAGVATIEAIFAPKDRDGYTWAFNTSIPHLVFLVKAGAETFGEGLIFALADVRKVVA